MTIKRYTPEHLDRLALRFLDIAAKMRNMAKAARYEKCYDIPIHDRKAILWCENLELWASKSEVSLQIALEEHRKNNASLADVQDCVSKE